MLNELDRFQVIPFISKLGWIALLFDDASKDGSIAQIKFGYNRELDLLRSIDERFDVRKPSVTEKRWADHLQKYAEGKKQDLTSIPVDLSDFTPFQTKVLNRCRKIPFGKTMTYGQLASRSGAPGAARAVGSTMKKNRFPLVIPCHRIVGSTGIGGYSAGDGVKVKTMLLSLEGVDY